MNGPGVRVPSGDPAQPFPSASHQLYLERTRPTLIRTTDTPHARGARRSAIGLPACRVAVGAVEGAEFLGVEFGFFEGGEVAAAVGQVTTVSTVAPLASQRRAKAAAASAAAAERPRPMATLRAPQLSASSVIRLNSASAGPDPAVSQARPDGSRGDNVIFPLLPEPYLVAGTAGLR